MLIKKRSSLRLFLGQIYFTLRKKYSWYFSGKIFAQTFSKNSLEHSVFGHQTPLLRQLKDVDMVLQYNKIKNLEIAIKKLDGLLIKPGETFSFWRCIGKPTQHKGYIEGMVLWNGQVKKGIGGGLCQLSNLLYWMMLHTPLTITERWRHSYDVFPDSKRSQPFGSGATCAYPNIDLECKNNTNQIFELKVHLTDKYLLGEWRSNKPLIISYEIFEKNAQIRELWETISAIMKSGEIL